MFMLRRRVRYCFDIRISIRIMAFILSISFLIVCDFNRGKLFCKRFLLRAGEKCGILKMRKYTYVLLNKKIMKRIDFESTLLVPLPKYAGKDFRWIDTFRASAPNGSSDICHVLVFNVEHKDGIKPMLEKALEAMKEAEEPDATLEANMEFLEKTINAIGVSGWEHEAPVGVLDALERASRQRFAAKEVIYLSGVARIEA